MRAIRKVFILLVVLLGAPNVYAENENATGLPLPATQNPPNRATTHIDYLGNNFLTPAGNPSAREPVSFSATKERIATAVAPNDNSPAGLHWVTESQHPALELRLSDQGAIRFHPTRHGGSVAAGWKF